MATKKQSSKEAGLTNKQALGLGLGITAAVAAAAGGFFLYGSKNAAKNRKLVKSWALKAKAEVLEGLEKAKNMSQEEYEQLVETVVGTYLTAKSASKAELSDFKKEMKEHWKVIAKTAAPKKPVAKKATKKVSQKTTKAKA